MNTMQTINLMQVRILTSLDVLGSTNRRQLQLHSGVSNAPLDRELKDLHARDLVIFDMTVRSQGATIMMTEAGERALAAYQEVKRRWANGTGKKVPPRTISIFGSFYRPGQGGYVRNDGNLSIPSRGVAC
jgi:hypothetical protein